MVAFIGSADVSQKFSLFVRLGLQLLFAAFLLSMSACQSSRYKQFDAVRGGMSKSEVIDVLGGPQRTQRWHGRDRWEYTFYGTPEGKMVREVHFENGVSTYTGPAIKPAVSAAEQDRINDIQNREADIRESATFSNESRGIEVQRFDPLPDSDATSNQPPEKKSGVSP